MSQPTPTAFQQDGFRFNRPVMLGVLAFHMVLLALVAFAPLSQEDRQSRITPPTPLQMVTVELITPAVPLPMAATQAVPQVVSAAPAMVNQPRQRVAVFKPSAPIPSRAPAAAASPASNTSQSAMPTTSSATAITTQTAPVSGGGEKSSASASVASASPVAATGAETTTPPRFGAAYLNNPAPRYPAIARRMGQQGKVLLRVLVTPAGTAKEVRLYASSGSEALDDSAMAAVKRWRFVPARQGNNPVEAWVQVPIVFKLD